MLNALKDFFWEIYKLYNIKFKKIEYVLKGLNAHKIFQRVILTDLPPRPGMFGGAQIASTGAPGRTCLTGRQIPLPASTHYPGAPEETPNTRSALGLRISHPTAWACNSQKLNQQGILCRQLGIASPNRELLGIIAA